MLIMKNNKLMTFRIGEELHSELATIARELDLSSSQVIRRLIKDFTTQHKTNKVDASVPFNINI